MLTAGRKRAAVETVQAALPLRVAGPGWLWCWRKWSKEERHSAVRRIGTAFAVVQLGTIFAASRALRADRKRQRKVVLDLR